MKSFLNTAFLVTLIAAPLTAAGGQSSSSASSVSRFIGDCSNSSSKECQLKFTPVAVKDDTLLAPLGVKKTPKKSAGKNLKKAVAGRTDYRKFGLNARLGDLDESDSRDASLPSHGGRIPAAKLDALKAASAPKAVAQVVVPAALLEATTPVAAVAPAFESAPEVDTAVLSAIKAQVEAPVAIAASPEAAESEEYTPSESQINLIQKMRDTAARKRNVPEAPVAKERTAALIKESQEVSAPEAVAKKHIVPGHERSFKEIVDNKVIYDLSLEIKGDVVIPHGLVFKDALKCAGDNFAIVEFPDAETRKASKTPVTQVGYRFYDRGHALEKCMAALAKTGSCDEDEAHACVDIGSFSQSLVPVVSLKGTGDANTLVSIGFAKKTPNTINKFEFEGVLNYKPAAFAQREAREYRAQSARRSFEEAQEEIKGCRATEDDLVVAARSCSMLSQIRGSALLVDASLAGEIAAAQAECEPALLKEYFLKLVGTLRKAGKADDIAVAADKLIAFTKGHTQFTYEAVKELRSAAMNARRSQAMPFQADPSMGAQNGAMAQQRAQEERLAVARGILEKMKDQLSLPEDYVAMLDKDIRDLALSSCQNMAQAYGIAAPQVQMCLQESQMMAQATLAESCQSWETRASCLDAQMQSATVGNIYKAAVQKTQADQVEYQKQQIAMQQQIASQNGGLSAWNNTLLQQAPLTAGFGGSVGASSSFNPANNPLNPMGLTNIGMQSGSLSGTGSTQSFGPLVSVK